MDPFFGGLIASGITGLAGIIGGNSQRAQERKLNQKVIEETYAFNKENYKYTWGETRRDYRHRLEGVGIERANIQANIAWQDETDLRSYNDELAIRNYTYQNEMRQFQQSEQNYQLQRGFNELAATSARESENRRFQEILTGMAFEQQDMFVKMLEQEGAIQARGGSGRSAGKVLASAIAGYGRNQAIMAESLASATKENRISMRDIDLRKYGADLEANSRRMLTPLKAPDPSAPLKRPVPVLQDPRRPRKPPAPRKGVNTVPRANPMAIGAQVIGLGAELAGSYAANKMKYASSRSIA